MPLRQETRGFNEVTGTTHTLRTKEDAEDYRYMPDPNLPPVAIAQVNRRDSDSFESIESGLNL